MPTTKQLLEAVEHRGLLDTHPLLLFTQPRTLHLHRIGMRYEDCNCLVDAVEQLFRTLDPQTQKAHRGTRSRTTVLASETIRACVVIETKIQGWHAYDWSSYCTCIRIWAPPDVVPQIVQRLVQAQNGDPIGSGIDWVKIEKAWKIKRSDAIAQWRALLTETRLSDTKPPSELTFAAMTGESGIRVCWKCGTKNPEFALFCAGCGESINGQG